MNIRTMQCVPLPSFSESGPIFQEKLTKNDRLRHGGVGLKRHYSSRTLAKLGELQGQMCLRQR